MKRIGVISIFLLSFLQAKSQQFPLYSQYIFNLYSINPAYAGERDAISTALSYRTQWVGFEGAPKTGGFSVHSPLMNKNLAVGLWVQSDQIGAREMTSFEASFSYKIRLEGTKRLSFALSAGAYNHRYNWNELDFPDGSDPVAFETETNIWQPVFDFGFMYLDNRSYIGLSALNLNGGRLASNDVIDARLEPNINLVAGRVFPAFQKVDLKPSGMLRWQEGSPVQFDLSLSARFFESLWLTTTYRHDFGMVFSGHFYANDKLHFGYAYDLLTNNLLAQQSGTHEIFIGFDFNVYRTNPPRTRFIR